MNQIDVLKWLAKRPRRCIPRGQVGGVRETLFNELCVLGEASWAGDGHRWHVWITDKGRLRLAEHTRYEGPAKVLADSIREFEDARILAELGDE